MTRYEDVTKLWALYEGDRDATYAEFVRTRTSYDVQLAAAQNPLDKTILYPMYAFRYRKLIKDIIQKRVEFRPRNYTVDVLVDGKSDTALTTLLTVYLKKPLFANKTVEEMLPFIYTVQEVTGMVVIKFFTDVPKGDPGGN